MLMAGCQDKKIYQWDMETGDLMQARDIDLIYAYKYRLSNITQSGTSFVRGL